MVNISCHSNGLYILLPILIAVFLLKWRLVFYVTHSQCSLLFYICSSFRVVLGSLILWLVSFKTGENYTGWLPTGSLMSKPFHLWFDVISAILCQGHRDCVYPRDVPFSTSSLSTAGTYLTANHVETSLVRWGYWHCLSTHTGSAWLMRTFNIRSGFFSSTVIYCHLLTMLIVILWQLE